MRYIPSKFLKDDERISLWQLENARDLIQRESARKLN